MKTFLKKIIAALVLLFILAFPNTARAESIDSINLEVYIDKNGIGHVSETWTTQDDNYDSTERYKVISDLRGIEIRDFKVRNQTKEFTEMRPWDLDKSFDEKAYRYGMIEGDNKVELCWGISERGDNEFILDYTINPVVIGLNDYDMVYFRFIKENLKPLPKEIRMEVYADEPFGDEVSMWGFGFEGDVHNENGKIVAQSTGKVAFGQLMLRFSKGTFNTSYTMDEDFEYFSKQAVKGSDWEDSNAYYEEEKDMGSLIDNFLIPFLVMLAIFFTFVPVISKSRAESNKYAILNSRDLTKAKKFKNEYFHEIPYDGPIEDTYLIADNAYYDIAIENYMNAYFLKWVYEGAITFGEEEVTKFIKTKKVPHITINHKPANMAPMEARFFEIIEGAARNDKDGKLHQRDIEDYLKVHKTTMENYIDDFPEQFLKALEQGGYVVNDRKRTKNPFSSSVYKNRIFITDSGVELYERFIKFKNYLKDYSLIEERHVNEVKLWDQFMIYAAIYGISEEVYENFTAIYPEYAQISTYDYYMIRGLNTYTSQFSSSMAQTLSNFESSSSGGFSSFGGGGGSFGGGSGGSGGGSR